MKIAICSSMMFSKEIIEIKEKLEKLGHEVFTPVMEAHNIPRSEHGTKKIELDLIRTHFRKIDKSDAILVLNNHKNNVKNYVGGNSFLEMGKAFDAGKKIFILNPIPEMSYTPEIIAMQPIILNGNLELIK